MAPVGRGRGRGGRRGRGHEPSGVPSPLGQSHASSSSSMSPGFSSSPSIQVQENFEDSSEHSESRKRKWNSQVWSHYNIFEGTLYADGIPRAICKYCNGGPELANSTNGTSNFKRHTEACHAHPIRDSAEMVVGKDGLLVKKISHFFSKRKVALAIIRHGYPFTYAEHEGNAEVYKYLNDTVKPISRNTAKSHCMKIHKREKMRLTTELGKITGKICLTCDMWTSCVDQGYLSLTAHYIDDDWNLHAKILNFCHLEPPHNAVNMHDKLLEFIKEWEIPKKVLTVTLDNARCNDNMQDLLAASLKVYSPLPCDGKYFHVRCGAHILNLIVQEGLKLIDKGVAKVKKLVTYIGTSERRFLKFEENVIACGLDCSKGLCTDTPTRWNSTFKMLSRARYFRDAIVSRGASSRYDASFPPLPTKEEWSRIDTMCALLKPFDDITTLMSGRKYPTSNLYFLNVWKIECLLVEYEACEDGVLSEMARQMKVKFDKYWDSYSFIFAFGAILDPRYKLQLIKYCFKELDVVTCEAKTNIVKFELYKLFDEYVNLAPTNMDGQVANSRPREDNLPGFSTFENSIIRGRRTQLDLYLDEIRMEHTMDIDVLKWWKENEKRFPVVAAMARDVLAILVTTVASESAFSMGSRTITKWRSSLNPETADALLTARTWLYGFNIKGARNENIELDGFEYAFSNMRISEDQDVNNDDDEEEWE